jgi:hypothetical protein
MKENCYFQTSTALNLIKKPLVPRILYNSWVPVQKQYMAPHMSLIFYTEFSEKVIVLQ